MTLTTTDPPSNSNNSCSQVAADTGLSSLEQPVSPSKQLDLSCAKHPSSKSRHLHRRGPYDASAKSPGSCSSEGGESVQSDADTQDPTTRMQNKVKRIAANSRERKRMHTVNSAFDQLRELVPTYPSNRKLSKIDTLRLACSYIQDLVSVLQAIHNDNNLPPFSDTFAGYPPTFKEEFQPYPPACVFQTESCPETFSSESADSRATVPSPPHHFMPTQIAAPPPHSVGSRPPPLTRVTSKGSAIRITTEASSGSQSPPGPPPCTPLTLPLLPQPAQTQPTTSMYQQQQHQQVNITSPLTMHTVHHSTTITPSSGLGQHSPPPPPPPTTWPNGFTLYGQ